MVIHECDTCHGEANVLAMVPGSTGEPVEGMVECPDCEDGYIELPDRFERLVGVRRAERIRRPVRRAQRRVEWARQRWAERDATTVGAMVTTHRAVLDDEPRLRGMIDHELRDQLEDVTPLRWRQADLRWCWENAKRALRGRVMKPLPYDEFVDVRVSTEAAGLFERGQVAIIAERRRKSR